MDDRVPVPIKHGQPAEVQPTFVQNVQATHGRRNARESGELDVKRGHGTLLLFRFSG